MLARLPRRFTAALALYLLIGAMLAISRGFFQAASPSRVLVLAAGFAAFAITVLVRRGSPDEMNASTARRLLAAGIVFDACLLMRSTRLMYVTSVQLLPLMWWLHALLVACASVGALTVWHPGGANRRRAVVAFVAAGAVLFALRVATLLASPQPLIDTWTSGTIGVDALFAGHNPYTAVYPDRYAGSYDYTPAFFYWPSYLYWIAPFRALFGDIRYATIAADLVTAILIVAIARRRGLAPTVAAMLAVLWLANPVGLFVLEQAWADPVLIAGVACAAAGIVSRRWVLTGVAFGLIASTKQYGVLVVGFALLWMWTRERRNVIRVLVALVATCLVVVGPFLVTDAAAFFDSTVQKYVDVAPRRDAFSLSSWLLNVYGLQIPQRLILVMYGVVLMGGAMWMARARRIDAGDWATILPFVYGVVFLLGKVAFCNYYYFVAFLLVNQLIFEAPVPVVELRAVDRRAA